LVPLDVLVCRAVLLPPHLQPFVVSKLPIHD
jgi:hypothetical protein